MKIRQATLQDISAITEIYNYAVEKTTAIWNETTVDLVNRQQWLLEKQQQGYPVLLVCENQKVLGYATFGNWRNFDGFKFTVEHSVYVHPDHQKKGVGLVLLDALIEQAKQLDKKVMVAAIEAQNIGSIRLHQKLGFKEVGTFKNVGFKFDRWLDLTFFELQLSA